MWLLSPRSPQLSGTAQLCKGPWGQKTLRPGCSLKPHHSALFGQAQEPGRPRMPLDFGWREGKGRSLCARHSIGHLSRVLFCLGLTWLYQGSLLVGLAFPLFGAGDQTRLDCTRHCCPVSPLLELRTHHGGHCSLCLSSPQSFSILSSPSTLGPARLQTVEQRA